MRKLALVLLFAAVALAPVPASRASGGDRVVTVTLVRWPYT